MQKMEPFINLPLNGIEESYPNHTQQLKVDPQCLKIFGLVQIIQKYFIAIYLPSTMVPARWRSTPWLTRKVSSMLRTGLRLSNLDIFFLGLTSTSMLPVALPGPWRLRLGLSRMLETCTDPRHVTIDTELHHL